MRVAGGGGGLGGCLRKEKTYEGGRYYKYTNKVKKEGEKTVLHPDGNQGVVKQLRAGALGKPANIEQKNCQTASPSAAKEHGKWESPRRIGAYGTEGDRPVQNQVQNLGKCA